MEWKEAFEAAVEKTVGAYEKMEKAIFSDDKEDFKRCHADYCRYIDLFSKATGIPESHYTREPYSSSRAIQPSSFVA